jgi:hypothetical protein
MRSYSTLFALAAMLTALPAHAADRSEVIPLSYLQAAELDQFLANGGSQTGPFGGGPALGARGLGGNKNRSFIPSGIQAWAVDERKNALTVTGDEEAIEQLKRIVRLLDIPARQIRMTVRLVELDRTDARALRERPEAATREGVTILTLTKPADVKPLQERPALLASQLQVSNNRMLHLRLPAAAGEARHASLIPRVNGDGAITLIATALLPGAAPQLLFRMPSGQTGVVLEGDRRAWLITPELQPDPATVRRGE